MNFPSWPSFDQKTRSAVDSVLASGNVNYWTGSLVKEFEQEYSCWSGSLHSVACANGSLALSLAYLSLGIGPGDEVITTPRTFIATASSIVLLGAKPIFADIDINSGSITAASIEPLITSKTKAVSVVHLGGWPADMLEIINLCKSYGIFVVEDCAQAHGATISGRSVGTFGDVSAWSFCQDKIITTAGEGGMVCTNRPELWDSIWSFKDHGKTIQSIFKTQHPPGFRWVHDRFGSNFRLTELQAAVGLIQLHCLSEWTNIRAFNANLLILSLSKFSCVRVPIPSEMLTHAWYKFYAYLVPESIKSDWSRERIVNEINILGYPAFSGSCCEIYLEKCFVDAGLNPSERLPVAKFVGETSLMFLVHPTITPDIMEKYVSAICSVLQRASL